MLAGRSRGGWFVQWGARLSFLGSSSKHNCGRDWPWRGWRKCLQMRRSSSMLEALIGEFRPEVDDFR